MAVIITVILILAGGIILIRGVGIIWFDFLIVIIVLLFHPILEKKIGAALHRWFEKKDEPTTTLEETE